MKSAYLRLVDADNHNREFKMIQVSQGVFTGMMNRVGAAPLKRSYPMSRWEQVYAEKIRKGIFRVFSFLVLTIIYSCDKYYFADIISEIISSNMTERRT